MNENKETSKSFYIIMGRSGCGKGTQAELLKSYLENENKKALHITTGAGFREFINSESYTAKVSKNIVNSGGLMPEFLVVWNWSNIFINTIKGGECIILDGAPRKLIEVKALESAINFYDYKKVIVIYLDVSKDWATDKLTSRGREDDNDKEEQERKMKWFDENVTECINAYKEISAQNNTKYNFIHVDGEQNVESVHAEIISKLK